MLCGKVGDDEVLLVRKGDEPFAWELIARSKKCASSKQTISFIEAFAGRVRPIKLSLQ
jgi:hypothetical protein